MKSINRVNRTGGRSLLAVCLLSLAMVGCGGGSGEPVPDSDGGIVGTGIIFKGTVTSDNRLVANVLQTKSADGERSSVAVDVNGRYQSSVVGQSPHLLRADLGNGNFEYSLGFANNNQITQNLHSYTDAAVRNFFTRQGLNIDAEFNSDGPLSSLPSVAEYNDTVNALAGIVASVQDDYGLTGVDIQTADFSADGTGLDQYLINNPVIINNGVINIIVNDPAGTVQSVAASNLSLSSDLSLADTEAPATPENLRALQASPNEAVIVWQPATDNIGVTEYEVSRDGVVIDVTPYPVFNDEELSPGTTYDYSVVALDAAGNSSLATPVATLTLSIEQDTIAPQAPISVQLDPSLTFIEVTWQHADISDVALFEVQRGIGNATPTDLTSVPSTFFTDTNLQSGTQYCYQIVAADSAGNQSVASQLACATTGGNSVVTEVVDPMPTETPTDMTVTPSTPMLASISTNCTVELTVNDIEVDTVLPADCYLVNGNLDVEEGANLTLSPGTVLSFGAGDSLNVSAGGSLTAEGTPEAPIVFTAQDPTPGFWDGIEFTFSNSSRNRLDNVIVEYGGGDVDEANIHLFSSGSNISRVSIRNSIVRNSAAVGVEIDNDSIVEAFENNFITNNEIPIEVATNNVPDLSSGLVLTGNTNDWIEVTGGTLEVAGTWQNHSVPYRVANLTLDETMTVAAGVVLEFSANDGLNVSSDGALQAVGTAAMPITFTGIDKTPGFWDGVAFTFSGSLSNRLEHVIIEYGGSASNENANLFLFSTSTLSVRLIANNVTVQHSVADGIHIDEFTILSQFDNITSTLNERAANINAEVVGSLGENLSFTGNAEDVIFVPNGDIARNESWNDHGVPYVVDGIDVVDTNLVVNPGVQMLMQSGASINVARDASLTIMGSAINPVSITGLEQLPGFWTGIRYSSSNSPNNSIDNAVIRHGGSSQGLVNMICGSTSPSRLSISNTLIADSATLGIRTSSDSCILQLDASVTFSNNADGNL